jgi:hypothetical protein
LDIVEESVETEDQFESDFRGCEDLLSYAANAGKHISDADATVVFEAAKAYRESLHLPPELRGRFYAAMSRIADAVAPVTAETLHKDNIREAAKALRLYRWITLISCVIVVVLSVIFLTMTRLSNDIAQLVKDNDAAALVLHNELQGYILDVSDSRSAVPGGQNLLVNSTTSLELKERLQTFARNNRQLYSDMTYLHQIWQRVNFFVKHRLSIFCEATVSHEAMDV